MGFFAHHKNTLLIKRRMQFFIEKRMLIGLKQFSHALRDSESMHLQMFLEMFCFPLLNIFPGAKNLLN